MRYTLLSFLCLITVVAYVQRTAMNGATKEIESSLGITSRELGMVMGAWYLAYAAFQLPSGWVADRLGSKPALLLFALLVPRPEPPLPPPQDEPAGDWHALPPPAPIAASVPWSKLITDGQMLLLCFQQFLRAGAMVFFFTWFARFLQEAKGLSPQAAGALAFWPPFAGAFGGVIGGLVSDRLLLHTGNSRLARQGMTFVALIGCTGAAGAACFVADPLLAVLLISVGTFCGMASGVSAYALAISYGGKRVATVFATM